MRVIWLSSAVEHIEDIYEFEAGKDPRYAVDIYNTIIEEADKLAAFPEMASKEFSLEQEEKQYRSLVVNSRYKVVYRFDANAEEIVVSSVWDCRQDPEMLKEKVTKKK